LATKEYNLHTVRTDLAKEWNTAKNDGLTPSDVRQILIKKCTGFAARATNGRIVFATEIRAGGAHTAVVAGCVRITVWKPSTPLSPRNGIQGKMDV
jgi:hypothetical protein